MRRGAAAYREATRATKRARALSWIAIGLLACGTEPESAAPAFDLQGHRGARALVPESTLPSFERALDLEVDTLELDLHWSADEELIV